MPYTVTNNPWTSQYCIGIGTETPCRDLHVAGASAKLRVGPYYADGDRDYLELQAQGLDSVIVTSNESMTIRNCGGVINLIPQDYVGIGLTTPCSILHVASGANTNGLFVSKIASCTNKQGIFIAADDSVGAYIAGGTSPNGTALQTDGFGRIILQNGATEGFQFQTSAVTGGSAQSWNTRMVIKNSGNVGIGISSPTALLQVRGPNATGTFFDAQNDGAAGATFSRIADTFPFNRYTFANGNVGIGTAAPLSNVRLQICDGNANGTDDMVRLMQCLPGNHAFYRSERCGGATMIMGPTRNSGDGCIPSDSAIIWTTGNNPIVIGTCGRQRMRFSTSGNAVLGGTNSNIVGFTGTVLTVNGGGNYQGYEVSTSDVTRMTMVSDGNNGYLSTRVAGMCLIFETGAATERMRITSAGNVGIGTTSPNVMLQVAGNFTLSGGTRCIVGDGGDLLIDTENVSGRDIILQSNSGQKVGVGTTTPSYRLHVNGTFYAAGSSIDYKEGICDYDSNSCLLMCLKPKTYQYKDEWKHLGKELKSETQIGLIAEEVAEVMPELAVLVNEDDNKVVRNVDYEKLSIVLLAEVQKLRQEVDQLKNK